MRKLSEKNWFQRVRLYILIYTLWNILWVRPLHSRQWLRLWQLIFLVFTVNVTCTGGDLAMKICYDPSHSGALSASGGLTMTTEGHINTPSCLGSTVTNSSAAQNWCAAGNIGLVLNLTANRLFECGTTITYGVRQLLNWRLCSICSYKNVSKYVYSWVLCIAPRIAVSCFCFEIQSDHFKLDSSDGGLEAEVWPKNVGIAVEILLQSLT